MMHPTPEKRKRKTVVPEKSSRTLSGFICNDLQGHHSAKSVDKTAIARNVAAPLLLLFLFTGPGSLSSRNDFFLLRRGDVVVVIELHGKGGSALGHGGQVVLVVQHLGHGDLGANDLRATL